MSDDNTKGSKQASPREPASSFKNKVVLPMFGKAFYLSDSNLVKTNGPKQAIIPEDLRTSLADLVEYPMSFGDLVLPCAPGVVVVFGGTGSGKTTILDKAIAKGLGDSSVDYKRILHLEDGAVDQVMSATDETLFYQILTFLHNQDERIILIDSISEWFTRSDGGNTGKGGVNTRIAFDLRVLNYAALQTGKVIIVALNPGARDAEVKASLIDDLAASVRLVVTIVNEEAVAFTTEPRQLELYYRYGDQPRVIRRAMVDLSKTETPEVTVEEPVQDTVVMDMENEQETTIAALVRLLKGNEDE